MFKFILLLSLAVNCYSVNILFVSDVPSPSHFIWSRALLNSLAEKGHNITALSPDIEASDKIHYIHLETIYPAIYNGSREFDFFEMGKISVWENIYEFVVFGELSCNSALESKGFQQLLDYPKDFKFDLVLHENTISLCLLSLADYFGNPPIVALTAYYPLSRLASTSGGLIYPAFVPSQYMLVPIEMCFMQRLKSMAVFYYENLLQHYIVYPMQDKIVRKRMKNTKMPYIGDIGRSTKLYLVNSNPLVQYTEPVFPNTKLVGGMQIRNAKALPNDLQTVLDAATNGVILFSLGTNVRSDKLGEERIGKIIKALGKLSSYTFLWKFETKDMLSVDLPTNLIIRDWMPQNDILAHPNTKLFISHCGLLSSQESIWFTVPILCLPIFADQPQNAYQLKELEVAESLKIANFTEDELYQTVKNMLENTKYKKNIEVLSKAYKDQPQSPLETATFWVEWVIRNPTVDTTNPSVHMGLITRQSFDLVAVLTLMLVALLYCFIKLVFLLRRIFKRSSKIDKNKKRN